MGKSLTPGIRPLCTTVARGHITQWCVAVALVLAGCGDQATAPEPPPPPPAGTIQPLSLTTFDGSGQAVHPDAAQAAATWGATGWYLAATPYPNGSAAKENPSIYAGDGWLAWHLPDGAENPVAHPPTNGYLSDPDLLYNPATNEFWLYYRQVTSNNEIFLIRSADGVHWTPPVLVLSVPNHLAVSPAIVRVAANDWRMWTVNSGGSGCTAPSTTVELRRSQDGITWSAPTTVTLTSTSTSTSTSNDAPEWPWHLDVIQVAERGEFWAVYNAKTAGSCTTKHLRFAISTDGVHWTTAPAPLLEHGAIPEFEDVVYRAALTYTPVTDQVTLWYSGARQTNGVYMWRVAVQHMARTTMFAIAAGDERVTASQRPAPLLRADVSQPLPPALTNETAP